MLNQARAAVHRWCARSWSLGPPTETSTCTAMVMTHVQWQHLGVRVEWASDAGGRHAGLRIGPFGVHVFADPTNNQLRREQLGFEEPDRQIVTRRAGGRMVHGWLSRREFGAAVEVCRIANGLHVRGLVGPFGFAVEPVDAEP
jgi:hypothetical protein